MGRQETELLQIQHEAIIAEREKRSYSPVIMRQLRPPSEFRGEDIYLDTPFIRYVVFVDAKGKHHLPSGSLEQLQKSLFAGPMSNHFISENDDTPSIVNLSGLITPAGGLFIDSQPLTVKLLTAEELVPQFPELDEPIRNQFFNIDGNIRADMYLKARRELDTRDSPERLQYEMKIQYQKYYFEQVSAELQRLPDTQKPLMYAQLVLEMDVLTEDMVRTIQTQAPDLYEILSLGSFAVSGATEFGECNFLILGDSIKEIKRDLESVNRTGEFDLYQDRLSSQQDSIFGTPTEMLGFFATVNELLQNIHSEVISGTFKPTHDSTPTKGILNGMVLNAFDHSLSLEKRWASLRHLVLAKIVKNNVGEYQKEQSNPTSWIESALESVKNDLKMSFVFASLTRGQMKEIHKNIIMREKSLASFVRKKLERKPKKIMDMTGITLFHDGKVDVEATYKMVYDFLDNILSKGLHIEISNFRENGEMAGSFDSILAILAEKYDKDFIVFKQSEEEKQNGRKVSGASKINWNELKFAITVINPANNNAEENDDSIVNHDNIQCAEIYVFPDRNSLLMKFYDDSRYALERLLLTPDLKSVSVFDMVFLQSQSEIKAICAELIEQRKHRLLSSAHEIVAKLQSFMIKMDHFLKLREKHRNGNKK